MKEVFITDVKIKKIRHLEDIKIDLSLSDRKHLIITGKNGSGKTTVLKHISDYLVEFSGLSRVNNEISRLWNSRKLRLKSIDNINTHPSNIGLLKINIETIEKKIQDLELESIIKFNDIVSFLESYEAGNFVLCSLGAKRISDIEKLSKTVEQVKIDQVVNVNTQIGKLFLKYLVFLRNQLLEAHFNKEFEKEKSYENWFLNFEKALKEIFEDNYLKLEYDSSNLNYRIIQTNHEPFDLTTLADGFSAILKILAEIILRMDGKSSAFDLQGVVLIDEIETHLHVSLQKKILPFLTTFFPKVQFIVTTHSPFIISSLENAIVYDLENKIRIEDASEFSYSAIVEEYLQAGTEYSDLLEEKMKEYEGLTKLQERNKEQNKRLAELDMDLATLKPLLSSEMYIRFISARKNILETTN